ncbi:MAG: CatB-related O-acetyltransferase [Candidatus Caenarcaniphilales bacterium]|nr:CatB-related O-acetyltransferase [Candidatus Caenarcaniphilales bacterium]
MNLNNKINQLGGRIAKTSFVAKDVILESPVDIADNVTIYGRCKVGKFSYINVSSVIYNSVSIGRFCSIGRFVEIGLARHPVSFLSTHPFQFSQALFTNNKDYQFERTIDWKFHEPVSIGNDVWIGAKTCIVGGIKIGNGSVIAAGSVVTKDVPPYAIVGGVPAKIMRFRFSEDIINELEEIKWWNFPLSQLHDIPFDSPEQCIKKLKEKKMHL